MTQHIYLDTGVLVPLLWDRDNELESTSDGIIKTLRGEVRSRDKSVKIPKIAIGEAIDQYIEDVQNGDIRPGFEPPEDRVLADLIDVVDTVEAEFESVKSRCIDIARELHRQDGGRMLRHNDLIIASIAVADPDSTHLIAYDDDYLECQAIRKVAQNLLDRGKREHGLTVAPEYTNR